MTKDVQPLIRRARIEDLQAILDIYNEAIETTTAIYEYECFDNAYIHRWWQQKCEASHR
jgi:L-amino acid N-acyltransferase YncA